MDFYEKELKVEEVKYYIKKMTDRPICVSTYEGGNYNIDYFGDFVLSSGAGTILEVKKSIYDNKNVIELEKNGYIVRKIGDFEEKKHPISEQASKMVVFDINKKDRYEKAILDSPCYSSGTKKMHDPEDVGRAGIIMNENGPELEILSYDRSKSDIKKLDERNPECMPVDMFERVSFLLNDYTKFHTKYISNCDIKEILEEAYMNYNFTEEEIEKYGKKCSEAIAGYSAMHVFYKILKMHKNNEIKLPEELSAYYIMLYKYEDVSSEWELYFEKQKNKTIEKGILSKSSNRDIENDVEEIEFDFESNDIGEYFNKE